jgi:alpha-L-fucosidase
MIQGDNLLEFVMNFSFGKKALKKIFILGLCLAFFWGACQRNPDFQNFVEISHKDSLADIVRKAAHVVPTSRQIEWQEMEFIGFLHFSVNTFSGREWGEGNEDPSLFNPSELNARQWVRVCQQAGMRQLILTAKHHDGFCLWPSQYTDHSVVNSPWRDGKGDVVKELADACREAGLKLGIYLSPWDRHERSYGNSPVYNAYFKNQLRELLTHYGAISEVWFDGACGEGPNGRKQVYDWEGYCTLVRRLQPAAVIAIMGPDVRWVGTETGYGRETEWSVIPILAEEMDMQAGIPQRKDLSLYFLPGGDRVQEDLGSRERLQAAAALTWYPSEVDVSIRPGWFYHAGQDDQVKASEKLVDIFYSSVGRNSVLLLNVPPDRRGLIHENDIRSLQGMRAILDATFQKNLAAGASVRAPEERTGQSPAFMVDGKPDTYWTSGSAKGAAVSKERPVILEVDLGWKRTFDCALLQEYIRWGQRVEGFVLQAWDGETWKTFVQGTTIGYKRLLRFPAIQAQKVRLVITEARASPVLSEFGLFKSPAG